MPSLNTKLATAPNTSSNYVLKATTSTTIGNSLIFDNGTNVGIGTASPNQALSVHSAGDTRLESVSTNNSSAGTYFRVLNGGTLTGNATMRVTNTGTFELYNGVLDASLKLSITSAGAATFSSSVDATIFNSTSNAFRLNGNNALSLVTLNSQSVVKINAAGFWGVQLVGANDQGIVINNSGNVGIGTASPTRKLHVSAAVNGVFDGMLVENTASNWFSLYQCKTGSSGIWQWGVWTDNNYRLGISGVGDFLSVTSGGSVCINSTSPLNSNAKLNINGELWMGNVTAGAGNSTLKYNSGTGLVTFDTSARIFKKDIVDLEYGLDSVLKMQPKKYKWKSNDYEDLGFIADEMYEIVPEIVALADNKVNNNGLNDGEPLSINYDRLVPVLVKAIQELKAELDSLKQLVK